MSAGDYFTLGGRLLIFRDAFFHCLPYNFTPGLQKFFLGWVVYFFFLRPAEMSLKIRLELQAGRFRDCGCLL